MDKVWYILIDEKEEGPYTPQELLYHPKVTSKTLVWKEGLPNWVPLRSVEELKDLFEDKYASNKDKSEKSTLKKLPINNELTLDYSRDPNFYLLLIILVVLLICYLFYKLY